MARVRGPRAVDMAQPPVVHISFLGVSRDDFPNLSKAAWNPWVSVLREGSKELLGQLDSHRGLENNDRRCVSFGARPLVKSHMVKGHPWHLSKEPR